MACPLRVGNESLPQMKEFQYLWVLLFLSKGTMARDGQENWSSRNNNALALLNCCDEKRVEPDGNMYVKVKKDWLYGAQSKIAAPLVGKEPLYVIPQLFWNLVDMYTKLKTT